MVYDASFSDLENNHTPPTLLRQIQNSVKTVTRCTPRPPEGNHAQRGWWEVSASPYNQRSRSKEQINIRIKGTFDV